MLITIKTVKVCFAIASVFLMLSAGSAAARRITVGSDDNKDFSSIQAAVDSAEPGDTVYVYSGIYRENVYLDKEITVRSISGKPEEYIVKAKDPHEHVFHVKANNVTISGFSIKGASDPEKAGIYLEKTRGTLVSNNKLSDNRLGIYLDTSNTNMLNVNNVSGNGVGIFLNGSGGNFVINNRVKLNSLEGIMLEASDGNRVSGNLLHFNTEYGIMLSNSSRNLIFNNYFQNAENVGYGGINAENVWNITKRRGVNIAGGPYMGGNYWTGPESTDLCIVEDLDEDGLCDASYNLGEGNVDHKPLILNTHTLRTSGRFITIPLLGFALLILVFAVFITKKVMGWGDDDLTRDDKE
nr:NosD domain-containing protein [Methanosarcina sp. KYL-1]